MAHRITCLIPTCKNICGRNHTKTTFLEIFFIGYHFITARKVSSANRVVDRLESLLSWRSSLRPTKFMLAALIPHRY